MGAAAALVAAADPPLDGAEGVAGRGRVRSARARLPRRAARRAVGGGQPGAHVRVRRLLGRDGAARRRARERLARAQPVARGRRRRSLADRAARAQLGAAGQVPGTAGPLAGGRAAVRLHGLRAGLPRLGRATLAGPRDPDLQLDHMGRGGRLRAGGVVRELRRLHGVLRLPLAHRPLRRARAGRQARARRAATAQGAHELGRPAGHARRARGDARLGRLRRLQPHGDLAEPAVRDRGGADLVTAASPTSS